MSSYASIEDLRQLGAHLLDELMPPEWSDEQLERLLDRAEQDVRAYLRLRDDDPAGWIESEGVGWQDPIAVSCLRRSTCEQAIHRLATGEDTIAEGPPVIASLPNISFSQTPRPLLGPEAIRALAACPLIHRHRHGLGVPPDDRRAA